MQIAQLVVPPSDHKKSQSATELLGPGHPLSTSSFEANVVYTASDLVAEDDLEKSVELVRQSVAPALPLETTQKQVSNVTWTVIRGILREGESDVIAQEVWITVHHDVLYSVTFSARGELANEIAPFAEKHLTTLQWAA